PCVTSTIPIMADSLLSALWGKGYGRGLWRPPGACHLAISLAFSAIPRQPRRGKRKLTGGRETGVESKKEFEPQRHRDTELGELRIKGAQIISVRCASVSLWLIFLLLHACTPPVHFRSLTPGSCRARVRDGGWRRGSRARRARCRASRRHRPSDGARRCSRSRR